MALPDITPDYVGQTVLASDEVLQVDTAYPGTPAWLTVFALTSFAPGVSATTADNSTFDTGIWGSNYISGMSAAWPVGVERQIFNGAEDPGQQFIKSKAIPAAGGTVLPVHVRHFSRLGLSGAEEAVALPAWSEGAGGPRDKKTATITLNIQGAPLGIANPVAVNSAPVVSAATPSAAAVGELVRILGSNFTGATQVKFGATNATDFDVSADNVIVASVPAGSAGTANITVINAVGTSNVFPYTRGA